MTKTEALSIFDLNEDFDSEEFQESLDIALFDLKQFFLSKVAIQKLFQSRINKLSQIITAQKILNQDVFGQNEDEFLFDLSSENILVVFNKYQEFNLQLKTKIANSYDAQDLLNLIKGLIKLDKVYAAHWNNSTLALEEVLVSKEADPALLLEAIRLYNRQGGNTFYDLHNNLNNPPEILIKEMKRLSLLFQNY